MSIWLRLLPVLIIAVALAALAPGCDRKPGAGVIHLATVLPQNHPTSTALKFFARRLEELSGGRLKVRIFFDGQRGKASQTLEDLQDGTLDMTHISAASITNMAYLANALAMPFIWTGSEHQYRALDGEIGEIIRREIGAYGLHILGFLDAGTRNINTKTGPIREPRDLAGMRIRVIEAPLMCETIQALGAVPVPLEQKEVYAALKDGRIDGWENNPLTVISFRTYETGCTFFAWTHHFSIPDVLVAGKPFLARLSEEERQWVEKAAAEMIPEQRKLWKESESKAIEEMIRNGMKINEVDPQVWQKPLQPIYEAYYEKRGEVFKDLCERIRALAVPASELHATSP